MKTVMHALCVVYEAPLSSSISAELASSSCSP